MYFPNIQNVVSSKGYKFFVCIFVPRFSFDSRIFCTNYDLPFCNILFTNSPFLLFLPNWFINSDKEVILNLAIQVPE